MPRLTSSLPRLCLAFASPLPRRLYLVIVFVIVFAIVFVMFRNRFRNRFRSRGKGEAKARQRRGKGEAKARQRRGNGEAKARQRHRHGHGQKSMVLCRRNCTSHFKVRTLTVRNFGKHGMYTVLCFPLHQFLFRKVLFYVDETVVRTSKFEL